MTFADFFYTLIFILMIYGLKRKYKEYKLENKKALTQPSSYTLELSGLPLDVIDEQDIVQHFSNPSFGMTGQIYECRIGRQYYGCLHKFLTRTQYNTNIARKKAQKALENDSAKQGIIHKKI